MAQPGNLQDPNFLESLRADVGVEAAPAFQWILDHARAIAGTVVTIVLVVAIVGGWKWYNAKQLAQAQFDVGLTVVTKKGAERLKALEELRASAPAEMSGAILLESALTAEEMEDAVQAAALWENAAENTSGPISSVARLAAANSLLAAGQNEQAVAALERLATTVESPLVPLVRLQFATAAEKTGDFERAATAYAQLAKEASDASDADFYDAQARRMRTKSTVGKE